MKQTFTLSYPKKRLNGVQDSNDWLHLPDLRLDTKIKITIIIPYFFYFLQSGSGMQLVMLCKATQTVIEKAPIDAVTGNSRNTLVEEKLLKHRVEYETMVKTSTANLLYQDLKISVYFLRNNIDRLHF